MASDSSGVYDFATRRDASRHVRSLLARRQASRRFVPERAFETVALLQLGTRPR